MSKYHPANYTKSTHPKRLEENKISGFLDCMACGEEHRAYLRVNAKNYYAIDCPGCGMSNQNQDSCLTYVARLLLYGRKDYAGRPVSLYFPEELSARIRLPDMSHEETILEIVEQYGGQARPFP